MNKKLKKFVFYCYFLILFIVVETNIDENNVILLLSDFNLIIIFDDKNSYENKKSSVNFEENIQKKLKENRPILSYYLLNFNKKQFESFDDDQGYFNFRCNRCSLAFIG